MEGKALLLVSSGAECFQNYSEIPYGLTSAKLLAALHETLHYLKYLSAYIISIFWWVYELD